MAINRSRPIRFCPTGLVDAWDATLLFEGACQSLSNFIFDPSNPELIVCRPGIELIADLATTFISPAFISVHIEIGTRIYGMVATGRYPGHDEPFCYDTSTGTFIPITGATNGNTPTSPATTGDWTPPTMANIGIKIIITHPGFNGSGSNFFGVIDVSNTAAPTYTSANTATNPLTGVPTAVANFFNRAYFAVGNQVQFTDVLDPLTVTNATQALVIGDQLSLNALSGLPVQTTSSGVIGALTIFKTNQTWQVTGDQALANLSLNYVSLDVGTNAPRSVTQSPQGIYFSSTGGLYMVNLLGVLIQVTHSIQQTASDIRAPFQNAQTPSRWAGAYTSGVYRVCGNTIVRGVQGVNDYWFDEHRRRWNGPHTFAYDCAGALADSSGTQYFVLTTANAPGKLLRSDPYQTLNTVFNDLGTAFLPSLKSSTFPKLGDMAKKQVAEAQIELAPSRNGVVNYTIIAQNELGIELGRATLGLAPNGGSVWDHFVWNEDAYWSAPLVAATWGGGALWGAVPIGSGLIWGAGNQSQVPVTVPVPWEFPLVFEKMQILIQPDAADATVGVFYSRYQQTGYKVLGTRIT
jgi:hypothetical protein